MHPDPEVIAQAGRALRAGQLVAIPTETVYGLGVDATDEAAVRRVFAAKGRPADDPLIVHVARSWPLDRALVDVPPLVDVLVERFWPGPLTIIGTRAPDIAPSVTSGRPSVAVRCPSHPVAAAIIEAADLPIAAPSANRFSYVSPTSADHVLADLGDACDLVIDAGRTTHGIESTVVELRGDQVRVLRHGAVTAEHLRTALGSGVEVVEATRDAGPITSPGRLDVHYSPTTTTIATRPGCSDARSGEASPSRRVAYLGFVDRPPTLPRGWRFIPLGTTDDLEAVAFDLYDLLRNVDAGGQTDLLIVELSEIDGLGRAIDDRLARAAGSTVAATPDELRAAVEGPAAR
jgi:L-threonylcarbamoyladenylate synthase